MLAQLGSAATGLSASLPWRKAAENYDNIRKTLQYLLAGNCGELLLMTAAIVLGLPMPLLAIHLP